MCLAYKIIPIVLESALALTTYATSKCDNKGISINQIPIYFANRKQGKSKIPKIELFRTLFNIIKLKLKNKL